MRKKTDFIKDLEAVIFKHDKDIETGLLDENVAHFLNACLQGLIDNTTGDAHFLNRGPDKAKTPRVMLKIRSDSEHHGFEVPGEGADWKTLGQAEIEVCEDCAKRILS